MQFISIQFLGFLGIVFFLYYIIGIINKKHQWIILLIASYVFYGFYSVKYILFLLFSTLVTWGISIGINECVLAEKFELLSDNALTKEKKKSLQSLYDKKKKAWIFLAIVLNLGLLFIIKYVNFSIDILNSITKWEFKKLSWVVLPLGFSFYTFQSLGYCIDVYRGTVEVQHNLFKYALFVSFFPQLCEGPIGNYNELFPQLVTEHRFSYESFIKGLIRILIGFFKKIVIADRLALFINPVYANYNDYSGITLCIATILYSIQLYADFSGYIDIALGSGQCFGIKLMENFSTPYFSSSITEFWRRWHISLGAWFKNYLYYPILRTSYISKLGKTLNKAGKKKLSAILTATIGLVITWTLIGMWHGAGFKYIVYGWYHGLFIVLAVWLNEYYKKLKRILHIKNNCIWKLFQIFRTFIIVTIGYVIFRAASLRDALSIYRKIINSFICEKSISELHILSRGDWIILFFGILICFVFEVIECRKRISEWIYSRNIVIRWSILYILMTITVLFFLIRPADSSNFIYFNF